MSELWIGGLIGAALTALLVLVLRGKG